LKPKPRDRFQAWLWGEVVVMLLLGAGLGIFLALPELPSEYVLPELGLLTRALVACAAGIVAVLAGIRFSVDGRRLDLLLACGFFLAAVETFSFGVVPALAGEVVGRTEAWADVGGRLATAALVAVAPFLPGRIVRRNRALRAGLGLGALALAALWLTADRLGVALPQLLPSGSDDPPLLLTISLGLQAVLSLAALIGFGLRYRRHGQDLDNWLALGLTFLLFSALHLVFTPLVSSQHVTHGDFVRVLGFAVPLVGVWRAIRSTEFGRVVAEERARVAREIHDGLAQYLFAVSTQVSLLESGASPDRVLPRLKEAAAAAQQEARFAVLALSSASGTAPFDAALRRYVEVLTADGVLDVELEIDPGAKLAPDEQIEVFRIVQEGLANVRKHAGARHAEVTIGRREGRRLVRVRDDGHGFDGEEREAGQGLKNMRARAAAIGGAFALRSYPGQGTALEVVLR
jgi:signal transduction histidine kinase